jgi:hypothetical protein|tara:strand:+ start:388 stop:1107 length:720 start_codon:yes stop_codon:yes gene_type:complete
MKFGHYADRELPESVGINKPPLMDYKTNSHGYRCPEWEPMPDGKKNVVVLGCSHTFGQGNADNEHWVHFLSQHNTERLRYWNLGQPGCSADKIVRILYGCEKLIDPRIVIVCWPAWSRRERLGKYAESLTSDATQLSVENDATDKNNFLKNVFFVEKYAEQNNCKVFHCFAQDSYEEHIKDCTVLGEYTLKNCWPYWDKFTARDLHTEPSLASDGVHYGVKHHERFAKLFLEKFSVKLK